MGGRARQHSPAWVRGRAPERQGTQKSCRPKASAVSLPYKDPIAVLRAVSHLWRASLSRTLSRQTDFVCGRAFLQSQEHVTHSQTPRAPCKHGPDLHAGGGKNQRTDFQALKPRGTKPLMPRGVIILLLCFPRGEIQGYKTNSAEQKMPPGEGLRADTVEPEGGGEGTSHRTQGARRLTWWLSKRVHFCVQIKGLLEVCSQAL